MLTGYHDEMLRMARLRAEIADRKALRRWRMAQFFDRWVITPVLCVLGGLAAGVLVAAAVVGMLAFLAALLGG